MNRYSVKDLLTLRYLIIAQDGINSKHNTRGIIGIPHKKNGFGGHIAYSGIPYLGILYVFLVVLDCFLGVRK